MKDTIIAFVLLMAIFMPIIIALLMVRQPPSAPTCPEDAIYMGGGEYRDGHWDYLYCWDND